MKQTTTKTIALLSIVLSLVLGLFAPTVSLRADETEPDRLAEIKERGVIYVGTSPDYPPNEFYVLDDNNKKQLVGSDISLAQAIADKIGVELEIVPTDFNSVLANIQSAQVDFGIAGFAWTETRAEAMQFSIGYQREASDGWQGILTTKSIEEAYADLEAFKEAKLKIGVQAGSIQAEMAAHLTDEANITYLGTYDALALALNAGDIDAVVASTSNVEPMLETFTDFAILSEEDFNLDPEDKYSQTVIGFALGDEFASLIEVVNEVIDEAREAGDLERWVDEAKALMKDEVVEEDDADDADDADDVAEEDDKDVQDDSDTKDDAGTKDDKNED